VALPTHVLLITSLSHWQITNARAHQTETGFTLEIVFISQQCCIPDRCIPLAWIVDR